MTVADAAMILEISPSGVYSLCSMGLLSHHRVGAKSRSIRISQSDLDAYLRSRRVEADGPYEPEPAKPRRFKGEALVIPDVFADMRAREKARESAKRSR